MGFCRIEVWVFIVPAEPWAVSFSGNGVEVALLGVVIVFMPSGSRAQASRKEDEPSEGEG